MEIEPTNFRNLNHDELFIRIIFFINVSKEYDYSNANQQFNSRVEPIKSNIARSETVRIHKQ